MNRLWVRFSVIIGVVILVTITAPVVYRVIINEPSIQRRNPPLMPASQQNSEGTTDEAFLELVAQRTEQRLWSNFTYALIAGSVLGLSVGVLFSRMLVRPLNRLAQGATAIANRQLDYQVPIEGSQEIQVVAASFNQMATALEDAETLRRNMLADVTHELRHPIHILQGNLQAIMDGVYPLEMKEIAQLSSQTQHLTQLINDLHEIAEAEAHQLPLFKERSNLSQLIENTANDLRLLSEQQAIHLTTVIPSTPIFLNVDPSRMRQALNNLLHNAIRHTPEGGKVVLHISTQPALGQAEKTNREHEIQIQIEDTGEGISPEKLPHLFDRFYRIDQSRNRTQSGTGLGLAITKAIIEAHGGYIKATSDGLGQGSTFTIRLRPE